MGLFVLDEKEFSDNNLNKLTCAMRNFKLSRANIDYVYLIDIAYNLISDIDCTNFDIKINNNIPCTIYYDYNIFKLVNNLFLEMYNDKKIYKNYILYIKLVLNKILLDNSKLEILAKLLSKYVHITEYNTCYNNVLSDNTYEYKFKTNNHFEELSDYFFHNINPKKEIQINFYNNELILYTVNNRHIPLPEDMFIKCLSDYLIPTEKLDIVNYKNKKNIMTIDAEETFDETLEKLYKVVRKKNSKVYIKCALNKIFYVIEDYSHFVD